MGIPKNWTDDGTTLTATNGKKVVLGFRSHVLNYSGGWPEWNVPLEDEVHANPLEESNPSLGDGQRQTFSATTLEYTQARGVFEGWQGQELNKLRQEIATLKATHPALTPVAQG